MAKASRIEAWELGVPDMLEPPTTHERLTLKAPRQKTATLHAVGSDIASYVCTIGFGALAKVVKVLINSGASHSFLLTQLADHLQDYRTSRSAEQLEVGVANRESLTMRGHLQLLMAFRDWKASVGVYVLKLPYYDMILGRDWFSNQ